MINLNNTIEIRCPCCNELLSVTINNNELQISLLPDNTSDKDEITKILKDSNIELG